MTELSGLVGCSLVGVAAIGRFGPRHTYVILRSATIPELNIVEDF
jgi:hypothetical protein